MPADSSTPTPSAPTPSRGVMKVRVRYCECDPMGVAHHAAYFPWLEMARTELLRETGVTYADLEAAGTFLVIVKLEATYKRPAYYDDLIEIRTRVIGGEFASRVKIRHEYEIIRASGESPTTADSHGALAQRRTPGEVLFTASSVLACVDRQGRPTALPQWVVASE